MKKVVLSLTLFATVFFTGLYADPALGGGRGLFRIQDARVEEDGALVFATRWMFLRANLGENVTLYRGPLYGMEMNYAPYPFCELFGSLVGVIDFRTNPNALFYDWQGQILGAKLSIPFLPVVKVAALGTWVMPKSTYNFKETDGFLDRLASDKNSWRGLLSLRFWELHKTLPTLMFNYGQTLSGEKENFAGIGIEMASNAIDLFVEATSEADASAGFSALWGKDYTPRARITPGVRIKMGVLHLNGGVELGLTDAVPDYEGIFGLSFVSPFPKPPEKPWGRLVGKVEDARSGMPLEAKIRFIKRRLPALKTDPENGTFFLEKLPAGVVVVEASREGYIPEAVPLVIPDKGYATYTFKLKPLVPYGTVAGRVSDAYNGKPLEATISFIATNIPPVTSNPTTGFFRSDNVPAGLVVVRVEKEGYFPEERAVEVEDGGVTKLNFALSSLEMKGVFKGKVVDKQSGAPLAATISFLQGERPSLSTDATTGEFEMELPVGSYEVKVEVPGYLPQTSSFAITKGETTTRTFELVAKGMVLTLKGVYFEFGKATLRTESYPALMEAAQIMKDNPDIIVEIQGHTDNIGSEKANQILSEKRAYSVMNFLVQYGGIDPKRLSAKGYGESRPIASNDTEEGRQLNRRVEFVIRQ
ncbi:MAG: OmpA family protein [candidate division WOR-3 bacterium]|jgi:outer membrane protein OmpA-like peptidoglycan-associated protein|nr:OmpA family protein [candidate division WOR-3 bacterium]MDH7518149.1 OmpA family protein [bacterium]